LKILRVTSSYPRYNKPGSGFNAYFHSKYTNFKTLVITNYDEKKIINDLINVNVIEISHPLFDLGANKESIFKFYFKLLRKIIIQFIFFQKSKKHLKLFRPNVVHIYSPISSFIALYCKKKFNSKIFISLHGTDILRIHKYRFFLLLLRKFDNVLVVSDHITEILKKLRINSIFIGNAFDSNYFYRDSKVDRESYIINVGNLRWQKSHETLIRAFDIFEKKHSGYRLLIIGEGELRTSLENLIKNLSLQNKVMLLGQLAPEQINMYLNKSKMFVLTSINEGSPKVIYEAMATGTVVVSTNVGNVSSTLKDSGFLIESNTPEDIVLGMEKVLNCDYTNMSNKAIKYSNDYTWNSVGKRLNEVYKYEG